MLHVIFDPINFLFKENASTSCNEADYVLFIKFLFWKTLKRKGKQLNKFYHFHEIPNFYKFQNRRSKSFNCQFVCFWWYCFFFFEQTTLLVITIPRMWTISSYCALTENEKKYISRKFNGFREIFLFYLPKIWV